MSYVVGASFSSSRLTKVAVAGTEASLPLGALLDELGEAMGWGASSDAPSAASGGRAMVTDLVALEGRGVECVGGVWVEGCGDWPRDPGESSSVGQAAPPPPPPPPSVWLRRALSSRSAFCLPGNIQVSLWLRVHHHTHETTPNHNQ